MSDVVQFYGFQPNRGGFIACPFHGEKTPSMKIYTQPGRGFHCFGCGAGGTAIDFVMLLFNIPFPAAVVRLNADFGLGLSNERPDPRELERLRRARREKEKAEADRLAAYMAKVYEHRALWYAKLHLAPNSPDEDFAPAYVDACKRLDALGQWLDDNEVKR